MTDEEIIYHACTRPGTSLLSLMTMLFDFRDVLEGVACEIKDKVGDLSEDNWNPDYHLSLTITVEDARNVLRTIEELDKLFKEQS